MNQKITIMSPQNVSDEELKKYMNFDQLLQTRNKLVKKQKFITNIYIASIIIIGMLSIWYMNREDALQNKSTVTNSPQLIADSLSRNDAHALNDSSTLASEKNGVPVISPNAHAKENKLVPDTNTATKKSDKPVVVKEDSPSSDTYLQAEPIGGYSVLYDYFRKNIKYPQESLRDSVTGVLTVSFIVTESGAADKVEVTESLGTAFEQVAVDLIKKMPPWKPATLNGKPVKSRISLPITFELKKVDSNSK